MKPDKIVNNLASFKEKYHRSLGKTSRLGSSLASNRLLQIPKFQKEIEPRQLRFEDIERAQPISKSTQLIKDASYATLQRISRKTIRDSRIPKTEKPSKIRTAVLQIANTWGEGYSIDLSETPRTKQLSRTAKLVSSGSKEQEGIVHLAHTLPTMFSRETTRYFPDSESKSNNNNNNNYQEGKIKISSEKIISQRNQRTDKPNTTNTGLKYSTPQKSILISEQDQKQFPTHESIMTLKSNELFFCCQCCQYIFQIELLIHYPNCKQKPEKWNREQGLERLQKIEYVIDYTGQKQLKHTVQAIRNGCYPSNITYKHEGVRFMTTKDIRQALNLIYHRFFARRHVSNNIFI